MIRPFFHESSAFVSHRHYLVYDYVQSLVVTKHQRLSTLNSTDHFQLPRSLPPPAANSITYHFLITNPTMQNNIKPQDMNMDGYSDAYRTGYANGYTQGLNERDEMLRAAEAEALKEELEEMKQWAKKTKVNAPIPRDLLPILAKDPAKQMELAMKHMGLGEEK